MTVEESWVPKRADVLVIGGGMGGRAAAAAASEAGTRVVVVEKATHPGGSAAISVGMFWGPPDFESLRARVPLGDPDLGRAFVEAYPSAVEQIRGMGIAVGKQVQGAGNHGVQIVLEHLPTDKTNTLNTVTEAGTLLASIGKSDTSLLIDVYHMSRTHEPPEDILPWGPLVTHVHVAEVQQRAAPGRFGDDFRPYFSILHQVGYDQRISIECNWQNLAREVNPAIETVREQWTTSAERTV